MIYHETGTPIYTNCFSGFCANLEVDDNLLSGFLSAMTTMPEMFGEESLHAVELGSVKLHFDRTTPSGNIICIGVEKSIANKPNTEKRVKELAKQIEEKLESDFGDVQWAMSSKEVRDELEHTLLYDIFEPSLEYFNPSCSCGEVCTKLDDDKIKQEEVDGELAIWDKINQIYEKHDYGIFNPIYNLIVRLYLKVYYWRDNRAYQKALEQSETSNI